MSCMHHDGSESGDDDSKRDGDDADSPDRDAILARRKMLVATALVGIAIDGCERIRTPFTPCLEPMIVQTPAERDSATAAPPDAADAEPSLDAAVPEADADASTGEDARAQDSTTRPDAARRRPPAVNTWHRACLRYAYPPHACLNLALKTHSDDDDD